jgi:hypothetical protein
MILSLLEYEEEEDRRLKRIVCDFIREQRRQRQLLISNAQRFFYTNFLQSLSLFGTE